MFYLLMLALAGCVIDHQSVEFGCSEDFTDQIRIIPCRGVDGVEFGDVLEEAKKIFGEPDGVSRADGIDRAWIVMGYENGAYAGLSIGFIENVGENSIGPADYFFMDEDYMGRTSKEIGIGSTVDEVIKSYGEPVKTKPSGDWLDYFYCFGGKYLELMTDEGIVKRMSMGNYLPITNSPCMN